MAQISGLVGYNRQYSSVNKLFAGVGNDILDVLAGTGYGLNLNTANNVEFENFLDRIFFQNFSELPKTYNPDTNQWDTTYVNRCMISQYIKKFKTRLYLAKCKFANPQAPTDVNGNAIVFTNRVFYSDTLTAETASSNLTWGIEWGQNGATTSGSNQFYVESANSGKPVVQDFKARNIKVGDTLFITNFAPGTPQNPSTTGYVVQSINDNHTLTVTIAGTSVTNFTFPATNNSLHFWVGGNWFDIGTDDNDSITGLYEAYNRLSVYKLLKVWEYTGSDIEPVRKALGTSSNRSIGEDQNGNIYWFQGSDTTAGKTGIYMRDQYGLNVKKISRAIDPFIAGMSPTQFTKVVFWQEGPCLRWFVGNLLNKDYDINMTNAVITYNFQIGAWSVDPIGDVLTCSTVWIGANDQQDTYCGNNNGQVMKMNTGYNFNGADIPFAIETKPFYPADTESINKYYQLQVIASGHTRGIRVSYKLWDTPKLVDDRWIPLSELQGDKTEFVLPQAHKQGAGYQIRFSEISDQKNDIFIEKISMFYEIDRTVLKDQNKGP